MDAKRVAGWAQKYNIREFLCGYATVLYVECGGGYTNIHIKLHRTIHTHTHTHTHPKKPSIL